MLLGERLEDIQPLATKTMSEHKGMASGMPANVDDASGWPRAAQQQSIVGLKQSFPVDARIPVLTLQSLQMSDGR